MANRNKPQVVVVTLTATIWETDNEEEAIKIFKKDLSLKEKNIDSNRYSFATEVVNEDEG